MSISHLDLTLLSLTCSSLVNVNEKNLISQRVIYLFGHPGCIPVAAVIDLLIVIHPNLSQADLVAHDDFSSFGESVRTFRAEDVTDHRARDDFQLASTLPHLSIYFQLATRNTVRET